MVRRYGHAGKVDDNQRAIVAALRACGASVASLAGVGHGVPDLLVGWAGRTWLVEVKGRRGSLTPEQQQWHRDWRGVPVVVATNAEEAVRALYLERVEAERVETWGRVVP